MKTKKSRGSQTQLHTPQSEGEQRQKCKRSLAGHIFLFLNRRVEVMSSRSFIVVGQ